MTLQCHLGIRFIKSSYLIVVQLIARDLVLPFDVLQFLFKGTNMPLGHLNLVVEMSNYLLIMVE